MDPEQLKRFEALEKEQRELADKFRAYEELTHNLFPEFFDSDYEPTTESIEESSEEPSSHHI